MKVNTQDHGPAESVEKYMAADVTVIIPCYRCADTIERACRSVIEQTLKPKELILVEDCSDDAGKTINKLDGIKETYKGEIDSIIIILHKENGGPAKSRNTGWDKAGQPYIAFLDADDSWHPRKLEIQYTWMRLHPDATLTGHPTLYIEPHDALADLPGRWVVRHVEKYPLLLSNRFPTRSVMLRKDIEFRFDPEKRYAEDYLLWLRIVLDGNEAYRLELPLAYSFKPEFGAGGLSKNLWSMERGVLEAFTKLRDDGTISWSAMSFAAVFSLAKFLRRFMMVLFRKKCHEEIGLFHS